MNSINHPSPPLSFYLHRDRHTIWPPHKPRTLQLNDNGFSLMPLTSCRALPSFILAATAPPGGKLSVLQTGGVCLVAYWVANFVLPGLVLKDLQSKEKDKENPSEDER